MSIKSDSWIRRMAQEQRMIEPFAPDQVRSAEGQRIISYGTSSYGYDVRCAGEFKIFTNINTTIVDPKRFDEKSFVDLEADVCIIPPNSFALARTVEYLRIPRNVLTICCGKSTYARCFRGDTRVALVDGRSVTLEDMARRHEAGERFWGYSIGAHGRLIISLLDAPRHIGTDALLEVVLEDGARVYATPDHLFMRRDGCMAQAHSLRAGDALMPLYRDGARGEEVVYQPATGQLDPIRRLADEWSLRNGINQDARASHRHPIDLERRKSRLANIGPMSAAQHIRMRSAHTESPQELDRQEQGAAVHEALVRLGDDPRWRAGFSQIHAQRSAWRRFPRELASRPGAGAYRNHKVAAIRELPGDHDVYCLTVPEAGNFALEAGIFVHNCGIIVNVTPLEPEWEGHITLEFSNTTPLPAKIYANEGVAQLLFFESDEVCSTSYRDRGGKYMGQRGVTLPKA